MHLKFSQPAKLASIWTCGPFLHLTLTDLQGLRSVSGPDRCNGGSPHAGKTGPPRCDWMTGASAGAQIIARTHPTGSRRYPF
jgi:hypothetical protein